MTASERQSLRRAIDAARRQRVDTSDCGDTATMFSYKRGCRCRSCRRVISAYKRRWRNGHPDADRVYRREYKRRARTLSATGSALKRSHPKQPSISAAPSVAGANGGDTA